MERAQFGTNAEVHAAGAVIWALDRMVSTMSFPAGFFGSPASGSYSHRVTLRSARIGAAEFSVRNRHGESPAARNEYTSTSGQGMRTAQGAQFALQVEGAGGGEWRDAAAAGSHHHFDLRYVRCHVDAAGWRIARGQATGGRENAGDVDRSGELELVEQPQRIRNRPTG